MMHQPSLPHRDFIGRSMAKSKYADSLVELDHHDGRVVDKVRELGIKNDTLIERGVATAGTGRPATRRWPLCQTRSAPTDASGHQVDVAGCGDGVRRDVTTDR
jgi:arylsulfatase A-like enzyme